MPDAKRHQIWKVLAPILVGIVLTVFFFVLAGLAGGACHCVTPTTVFFPYAAIAWGAFSWESLGDLLIALQFPLYSITVAVVKSGKRKILTALILLASHVAAVMVGLKVFHH